MYEKLDHTTWEHIVSMTELELDFLPKGKKLVWLDYKTCCDKRNKMLRVRALFLSHLLSSVVFY